MISNNEFDLIHEWYCNSEQALKRRGITDEDFLWMEQNGVSISLQYIGLLRIYITEEGREKLNEKSDVVQIGSIRDSIAVGTTSDDEEEQHRQNLVDCLAKWIKDKQSSVAQR